MDELSSGMSYDIAWDQIQGRRRSQQDCAVCIPMGAAQHLLVLADGMGGHAAGRCRQFRGGDRLLQRL